MLNLLNILLNIPKGPPKAEKHSFTINKSYNFIDFMSC